MIFYHITTPEQLAIYSGADFYAARSLTYEGFVHASFAEQIDETLKIHFKNESKVVILTVDSDLLTAKLLIEQSRNGERFPHIYGAINKSAVIAVEERTLNV